MRKSAHPSNSNINSPRSKNTAALRRNNRAALRSKDSAVLRIKNTAALRIALAALLFAMVFTMTLTAISTSDMNFANALASQSVTAVSQSSSVSVTGTQFFTSLSASTFGISSSDGYATNDFGLYSDGWGWPESSSVSSDQRYVYWLQIDFANNSNMLTDVKNGAVSFYVSATGQYGHGIFTDDADDMMMGISFSSNTPTYSWLSSSNNGGWSEAGTSNLASGYYSESEDTNSAVSYEYGDFGAFSSNCVVPTSATSMKIVFGVFSDGAVYGGFKNIRVYLYKKQADSVGATGTSFSLTDILYGTATTVSVTSANNVSKTDENSSTYNTSINSVAAGSGTWSQTSPSLGALNLGGKETKSISLSSTYPGIMMIGASDDDTENYSATLSFSMTFNANVTKIDFSAVHRVWQNMDTAIESGEKATISSKLSVGSTEINTSSLSRTNSNGTTAQTGTASTVSKTGITIGSSHSITVTLEISAHKDDVGGSGDVHWWGVFLTNVKVTTYGKYYADFHSNGGSGSMGLSDVSGSPETQEFIYGESEALAENKYTNGNDYTFVGWSLSDSGSKKYDDKESVTGLTKVPGQHVDLYAVWIDHDFGIISGGSRTSTTNKWGSASNPFVINSMQYWMNLVDIVNGNRQPFDSITGSAYGKTFTTNAAQNDIAYTNCYFAITTDIGQSNGLLSLVEPVGSGKLVNNPAGTSVTSMFKGHIYGSTTSNAKTNRTVYANISASDMQYLGLFGYVQNAEISYLNLSGSVINSYTSSICYTGGIAGYADGSTISNCTVYANIIGAVYDSYGAVTAKSYLGGVVGQLAGSANQISNCTYSGGTKYVHNDVNNATNVNANIFGSSYVGGIVGEISNSSVGISTQISNCNVTKATIVGTTFVGGIAGGQINAALTIQSCTTDSSTSVTGTYNVGGILGAKTNATASNTLKISSSTNAASVTASAQYTLSPSYSASGGILGRTAGDTTIDACTNNGAISSTSTSTNVGVGGLIGYTTATTTFSGTSSNKGTITGSSNGVGGLIGYTTGAVTNEGTIRNEGAIKGVNYVGGLIGYFSAAATINATAESAGTVNGTSYIGGVVGYISGSNAVTLDGCTSSAAVTSSSDGVGGIVGSITGSGALTIQNCTNTGKVSANANGVAGILGHTVGTSYTGNLLIKGCKSTGDIEGKNNVGGIGGRIVSSGTMTVENCYTDGTISCHSSASNTDTFGGIIGYYYHNATSGNAVIRYCASSCTITLKGTVENGAGGIAGNFTNGAEKTDDGAPKVSYCYSFVTLSNSGTVDRNNLVGGVVGTSLNNHTVENSWYFKSSSTDTAANNNVFNTTSEPTKYGRYAIVLGGTGSTYFKPILSTETSDWSSTSWSATVTWTAWDDWTKITEKNFDGFANKYSNLTQPNNSTYIRCTYGSKEGDAFEPDYVVSEHVARDFDNAKSNFAVGFKATTTENIFVQRVKIEHTPDDSTSSASAATFTYNGSSQNITLTAPDTTEDTFYTVEYQYLSPENAVIDAKDVKNAGTYTVKLNIVIAGYVVGMKTIALTISPKSLSVSQKWTDNATTYPTHADFVYNTNHQGLSTVTITGVVDTESYESIFEIICNNGASFSIANKVYTFSGAIDVNSYQIAVKIISENYKWLSSDKEDPSARTYNWAITPKSIGSDSDIVFGYAFDEAEKFMNPGEMRDISGKVVSSGGTYYTLNSSFAHI